MDSFHGAHGAQPGSYAVTRMDSFFSGAAWIFFHEAFVFFGASGFRALVKHDGA